MFVIIYIFVSYVKDLLLDLVYIYNGGKIMLYSVMYIIYL